MTGFAVRRSLPTAVVALLAVGVITTLAGPDARALRVAAGVEPMQRHSTTLEILRHLSIPSSVAVGRDLTLLVRIRNEEAADATYTVGSSLVDERQNKTVMQNRPTVVDVKDGGFKDVRIAFVPRCVGRLRATVALVGRPESVHVWITSTARTKSAKRCA